MIFKFCSIFIHFLLFLVLCYKFAFSLDFCGIEDMHLTPTNEFNVTSPLFPKQYPLTIDCSWTLVTSIKGTVIVEFIILNTGHNYDKFYIASPNATIPLDVDETIEGPLVLRFSGSQVPRAMLLPHSELQMVWDPSVWSPDEQTGFVVRITLGGTNSKFRMLSKEESLMTSTY